MTLPFRVIAPLTLVALAGVTVYGQSSAPARAPGATATAPADDQGAPEGPTTINSRYHITESDVIEVQFPYVPEFTQTHTVQPDGYISMPTIGDVLAKGRTVPELQEALTERYREVLRDPVINIVLKEFERPFFIVTGEVGKPGKYELRGATTVSQALALAGGYLSSAKHSDVVLFRRFDDNWVEVKQVDVKKMYGTHDMSEDPLVRQGDTIVVPKSKMAKMAPYISVPALASYINLALWAK